MSIKHLFKAVAIITIFSLITRVLGFVFRIYLSRELGAELLGLYQLVSSIFGIFLCLVSSGLPLTVSKKTAEFEALNETKSSAKTVSASLIIGAILSIIAAIISIVSKPIFDKIFHNPLCYILLLILIPATFSSSIYSVFRGNLWGKKKYFLVSITELFEQIVRMGLCVVLMMGFFGTMDKLVATTLSLSIACVLSSILALIFYFTSGGKLSSSRGFIKPVLDSTMPITGVRLAGSIAQPIISFILPLRLIASGFSRSQALSSLGVIMGMTFPLLYLPSTLIGSLAMTLVPDISATQAKKDTKGLVSKIQSAIMFSLIVSFMLIPIFISVGNEIGLILFNNAESGKLLAQSCWIMAPMSISNITSSILNSLGMEVKSFKNYVFAALFMGVSIWFLPMYIGVGAIAIGMGAMSIVSAILNISMIQKYLGQKIKILKPIFNFSLFTALSALIGLNMLHLFNRFLPLFFASVASGLIAFGCFCLLISAFNYINLKSIFNQSLMFLSRRLKKMNKTAKAFSFF